jgi:hypothetical protein
LIDESSEVYSTTIKKLPKYKIDEFKEYGIKLGEIPVKRNLSDTLIYVTKKYGKKGLKKFLEQMNKALKLAAKHPKKSAMLFGVAVAYTHPEIINSIAEHAADSAICIATKAVSLMGKITEEVTKSGAKEVDKRVGNLSKKVWNIDSSLFSALLYYTVIFFIALFLLYLLPITRPIIATLRRIILKKVEVFEKKTIRKLEKQIQENSEDSDK